MSDTPNQGADADPVVPDDGGPQAPDEVVVTEGTEDDGAVDGENEEETE